MGDVAYFGKINLIVLNRSVYVWNIEDWLKLRNYRIVGNFIGSLAALPRQDQIAGLPFALLNEEVKLLLEKDYAVIKSLPSFLKSPRNSLQEKDKLHRKTVLSQQVDILTLKRKKEIEEKIDIILDGKKAKKRCPADSITTSVELSKETVLQEEFSKIQQPKDSSLVIQIFTEDPWIQPEDYEDCPWSYPNNNQENIQYSVFKNLWEKGYFITLGKKFGGDYLVYPGDPVKFHSFFIVVCLENTQKIQIKDIVAYGRLGHSVRKTVVLAYLNDQNKVCYHSLQWAGF